MLFNILEEQKIFYNSGFTKDVEFRKTALKKIKDELIKNLDLILASFKADLNKNEFDVISTEIMSVLEEIDYMIKNCSKIFKRKRVRTNLINFKSKSYTIKEPYGNVLIISPWNYPLQLSLLPLVGAIACGNTIILKLSEKSKNVSKTISKVLSVFDKKFIYVVDGDAEQSKQLLTLKFDYIFFTGSVQIGKIVMEQASKNLIPLTLELGGKSPCIVDELVDLDLACKRIVWGKFLNAGQTCVAPDYILIDKKIKSDFIDKLIFYIKKFYYINEKLNEKFTHVINEKHIVRLSNMLDKEKIIFGGNVVNKCMEPTIVDNVPIDDTIMKEEIFGPILPIIEFSSFDEALEIIKKQEKPLALYYFGKNKTHEEKVVNSLSFGGGCINDTIMHLTNNNLPFGGVGQSGFGSYHGKHSINTFSREKSILKKSKVELNTKYYPFDDKKLKLLKKISHIK